MTIKCPQKDCWAPEIVCNLGYDLDQCPHYKGEEAKEGNQSSSEDAFLLPWSGNSFGTVDLQFVAGRSKPTLIGVVGAHKAGKTTLLTTLYLLLGRGRRPLRARFAGSYTLGGWEILAQFLRWKPNQAPSFPPHTPFNAGRTPGLLHLSFRREDGCLQDVLLTDAPGELFTRWAIDKTATELESARWIARHADAFLLVVDSEALAGPRRGEARTSTLALAERLGDELNKRPAGVVWAKSDVALKDSVRRVLETSFAKLFPLRKEFHVSVQREDGRSRVTEEAFLDLLSWLLPSRLVIGIDPLTLAVQRADDPMIAFRG